MGTTSGVKFVYVRDILKADRSNFDTFRLIAAFAVIYGHAYALSSHPQGTDLILRVLKFDYSGSLAVKFFFALSGMLVTNSLLNRPDSLLFLARRSLRVFPALWLFLVLMVFVLGPLVTEVPIWDYFRDPRTLGFFSGNWNLLNIQWTLPGVFTSSKYGLDGTLWTLPWEMRCYFWLAALLALGAAVNRWVAAALSVGTIVLAFWFPMLLPGFDNADAQPLAGLFAVGALFAIFRDTIALRWSVAPVLFLATKLVPPPADQIAFYVASFYLVLLLASHPRLVSAKLPFDASYGVYLYGFPIQQVLYHSFPDMAVRTNQVLAMVLSMIMGIVSWYAVERWAIAFGRWLSYDRLTALAALLARGRIPGVGPTLLNTEKLAPESIGEAEPSVAKTPRGG